MTRDDCSRVGGAGCTATKDPAASGDRMEGMPSHRVRMRGMMNILGRMTQLVQQRIAHSNVQQDGQLQTYYAGGQTWPAGDSARLHGAQGWGAGRCCTGAGGLVIPSHPRPAALSVRRHETNRGGGLGGANRAEGPEKRRAQRNIRKMSCPRWRGLGGRRRSGLGRTVGEF